jgi:hypothetical protein
MDRKRRGREQCTGNSIQERILGKLQRRHDKDRVIRKAFEELHQAIEESSEKSRDIPTTSSLACQSSFQFWGYSGITSSAFIRDQDRISSLTPDAPFGVFEHF